jgi:hypothetical protein
VARTIHLCILSEDVLARALGDDDDGVPLLLEHALQVRQAALWADGHDRHLRDQAEVDVARADGGVHRDEARVPPHQLDDADACPRQPSERARAAARV